MRTSINRFLAKATGPTRLRSELSQKTRPMSALLGKIDVASAVRAEVPKNVLGGDILALMSEQFRQAIQYSGQDESATNDAPKSQFRLELPAFGSIAGRAEAGTFQQPLPAERPADPFPEFGTESLKKETGLPYSPVEQDRKAAAPFPESTPGAVPKVSWSGMKRDAAPGREDLSSSMGKAGSVGRSESQNVAPVLVEKLREYWRLSRPENPSEKVSAHPGSPITERDNAASFPAITRHAPIQKSWPEMTGRQVAEKIGSFISGRGTPGLARSARQVIQSDLPEKVEIQNVFNIQVKSEEGRENSRDLSEKIADILHEQALQHGIDVT